jgi:hypothetical protein
LDRKNREKTGKKPGKIRGKAKQRKRKEGSGREMPKWKLVEFGL